LLPIKLTDLPALKTCPTTFLNPFEFASYTALAAVFPPKE
jgi:hypothetical protein